RFDPWRALFLVAAVAILVGGPRHPSGTMAEMLAHTDWLFSHSMVLAGYLAFLAGLILYRRARALPALTARWSRLAVIGTTLQAVEMILHTAAVVDGEKLAAGLSTPILTTHLVLSVTMYPIFAATVIGLIVAGARERTLGSRWIAPIGILGTAAHGLAAPLVILLEVPGATFLFMGVAWFAAWCALTAFWPAPVPAAAADADPVGSRVAATTV
ncbi:MAG TPA: hypothetical protein VEW03_12715, partial [Longimicrobiaceae bacterium]|nr:hypothetical protein [Longimicrobiaceae bacterium]